MNPKVDLRITITLNDQELKAPVTVWIYAKDGQVETRVGTSLELTPELEHDILFRAEHLLRTHRWTVENERILLASGGLTRRYKVPADPRTQTLAS